jgi:hypothetical protein
LCLSHHLIESRSEQFASIMVCSAAICRYNPLGPCCNLLTTSHGEWLDSLDLAPTGIDHMGQTLSERRVFPFVGVTNEKNIPELG